MIPLSKSSCGKKVKGGKDNGGKNGNVYPENEKIPFGIISGAFGMVAFFATVGLIIGYLVVAGIAGQTMRTVSFFENWWQVLIFVADLISVIIAVGSLVMYILKKVYTNRAENAEVENEKA